MNKSKGENVILKTGLILCMLMGPVAWSQSLDVFDEESVREPSSLVIPGARSYPGGSDEDELQVQASLPDVDIRVDARTLQRKVFKELYNQDMSESHDDSQDD